MKPAQNQNQPSAPPKRNINMKQREGNDIFNQKGQGQEQQKPIRKLQDNNRMDTCPWGKPVFMDEKPKQIRQPAENPICQQQRQPYQQSKKPDFAADDEELMRYASENGLSKEQFSELVKQRYENNAQEPSKPQSYQAHNKPQQQPQQAIVNHQQEDINQNDEELINYAIENGLSREQFQELAAKQYNGKPQQQKPKARVDLSQVDPEIVKYGMEKGLNEEEIVLLMDKMKVGDQGNDNYQQEQRPVQQPQQVYQKQVQPQRGQQQQIQQQQIKQSNIQSNILAHEPIVQNKQVFKGISCPFAQISDHQSVQGQFSSKSTDKIGNQQQSAFDYSANQAYQERRSKARQGNNIFG